MRPAFIENKIDALLQRIRSGSKLRGLIPPRPLFGIFLAIAIASTVSTSWAQSVYWSPSSGTLQQGKGNTIDLFYDSCEPSGQPAVPSSSSLQLTFRGQSNSRTLINGRLSAKTILNYQITPTQRGSVTIPSFKVQTSQGELVVPAARYEVVEATVGNTGAKPDEVFLSAMQARDREIWQGEVFELEYMAGAKREYQLADLSIPEWEPSKIVTEGLVDDRVEGISLGGSTYTVKLYKANAMATEPGIVEVEPVSQNATVVVGRRRDFMFQEPVLDTFAIESEPLTLQIKPLPENAPNSFRGAVGSFALESHVVPQEVQVGEPVTWTLELSGSGNWPAGIGVPPRAVSSRFKAIQPKVKNEFPENKLFSGKQTEDIVLIPTEAGSFEFGPVSYTYFDTKEETYKTIDIPSTTITVTPATNQSPTLSPSDSGASDDVSTEYAQSSEQAYDLSPAGINAKDKPPELLKAPLTAGAPREIPSSSIQFLVPTVSALAVPLAFWFVLALRQSILRDENRQARKALSQLRKIVREPVPSNFADVKELHRRWRGTASVYFGFEQTEPTPREIERAAKDLKGNGLSDAWKCAWELSDQTLFSKANVDQQEWSKLARAAVEESPSRLLAPSALLKYKTWFPLIVTVLAVIALSTSGVAQESPAANPMSAYETGNFSDALAGWESAVEQNPAVVENRYNAGLAAAQTGKWGTAWGYWAGAFCLDPSNEAVAWNLKIAHQHTAAFDPTLDALLEGKGLYRFVRLQSPAAWQRSFFYLIYGMGALFILTIVSLYFRSFRRSASFLFILGVVSGVSAYFSIWAHAKYGELGQPDTVLVVEESPLLSVPTDLGAKQLETTVSEGSIVSPEKTFLGWVKVKAVNGDTGWLRSEKILPLYGSRSQL